MSDPDLPRNKDCEGTHASVAIPTNIAGMTHASAAAAFLAVPLEHTDLRQVRPSGRFGISRPKRRAIKTGILTSFASMELLMATDPSSITKPDAIAGESTSQSSPRPLDANPSRRGVFRRVLTSESFVSGMMVGSLAPPA